MTEPRVILRGAGNPAEVQREIELKALSPEERALSVAADLIVSAIAAPEDQRHALVLEALRAVYRRAVRDASQVAAAAGLGR